jgi:hypothetical protein
MFKTHPAISENKDLQATTPLIPTFSSPPYQQPYQNCPILQKLPNIFPSSQLKPYQNGLILLYKLTKVEIYVIP